MTMAQPNQRVERAGGSPVGVLRAVVAAGRSPARYRDSDGTERSSLG